MGKREDILAIFARRTPPPRPVVALRLDLWHRDAASRGVLPAAVAHLDPEQVMDHLGFARSARFRLGQRLEFPAASCHTWTDGDVTREEYRFPERTLVRETVCSAEMRRQGVRGHIVRYPVSTAEDLHTLERYMAEARLVFGVAGFDALDATTADRGLPMLIAGPCPAHLIMLEFTGYEQFYYLRADCPAQVDALIRAAEGVYRRDLWPAVSATRARLVLHGAHFNSQMTPRPRFSQHFLPYLRDFVDLMHGQNRYVLWHADAEMGDLLDLALACGFDGADCLATHPLVPQRLEDYLAAWQNRVVCWGGLPSTVFDPSFPRREYEAYVDAVVALARGRGDVILGASDNVMPGAEWERLEYLAEATAR